MGRRGGPQGGPRHTRPEPGNRPLSGLALGQKQITHTINRVGSMFSVHFCSNPVIDFETAQAGNNDTFKKFFHHLLAHGIYIPPSAFESWFLCAALTDEDIEATGAAITGF